MSDPLILTNLQKKLMKYFYETPQLRISLNKAERKNIWDDFVKNRDLENFSHLEKAVPAIYFEMEKALTQNQNIQSAVFSECVYAQTLAAKFKLSKFEHYLEHVKIDLLAKEKDSGKIPKLTVRYAYSSPSGNQVLYQAGGAGGVDCAFKTDFDPDFAMIELKEPYARTSDPNLPKYGEDGYIISSEEFEREYPQLVPMLKEHIKKNLNAFEHLGRNVNTFSTENIIKAVSENYSGEKFADFICTEDSNGFLVMLPSSDVSRWAKLEGELRPSGRNKAKVWTPIRLEKVLRDKGADIKSTNITMPLSLLKTTNKRGGSQTSRYKIDPSFYVYKKDLEIKGDFVHFDLSKVNQLIPSITAKMDFRGLKMADVKNYYLGLI
jgi:hypothetical protein